MGITRGAPNLGDFEGNTKEILVKITRGAPILGDLEGNTKGILVKCSCPAPDSGPSRWPLPGVEDYGAPPENERNVAPLRLHMTLSEEILDTLQKVKIIAPH